MIDEENKKRIINTLLHDFNITNHKKILSEEIEKIGNFLQDPNSLHKINLVITELENIQDSEYYDNTNFEYVDKEYYSETKNTKTYYALKNWPSYGLYEREEIPQILYNTMPVFDGNHKYSMKDDVRGILYNYIKNPHPYIEEYSEYLREIYDIVKSFKKLNSNTKTLLLVPCYMEENSIIETLENYCSADTGNFAIYLFENHPSTSNKDSTREKINIFRKKIKNKIPIFHFYKKFALRMPIGMIRKYQFDVMAMHVYLSEIKHNPIICTGDADLLDIDANYFNQIEKMFQKNSELDAVESKMLMPIEFRLKYQTFWIIRRIFDYIWKYSRYKLDTKTHSIRAVGPVTSVKLSSFLMIKGFNPRARLCEDLQTSWLLDYARKNSPPGKYFEFSNRGLTINPRRDISAYLSNVHFANMYDSFDENTEIRGIDWKGLLEKGSDEINIPRLEQELQGIFDSRWKPEIFTRKIYTEESFRKMFKTVMNYTGIEYELSPAYVIKIISVEKARKNIAKIKDDLEY